MKKLDYRAIIITFFADDLGIAFLPLKNI